MSHYVECEFELTFEPAIKKSPTRIEEIVAEELGVDTNDILSLSYDHDVPVDGYENAIRIRVEDGSTTVRGSYERMVHY